MRHLKCFIFFFPCFALFSCDRYPTDVEKALTLAGNNRSELEKVISHYNENLSDSLKLKAAYFLIANMPGHHFFKGKLLDTYMSFLDSTLDRSKRGHQREMFSSFVDKHGLFDYNRLEEKFDVNEIKSDYLITNIDFAFKTWFLQPWKNEISFDIFCNYVLPYRVSNEVPEQWREELYNKFNPLLDSVRSVNGDIIMACKAICRVIKDTLDGGAQFLASLPSQGPTRLLKYRTGTCREQAQYATYVMRALGIPVTIDYTPQWPFRSLGHSWNVVFANGKAIPFMGTETMPGEPHKEGYKYAKVFRETFSINKRSLAYTGENKEIIPSTFDEPFMVDVTNEMVTTSDVTVQLSKIVNSKCKFAYLAVFDNRNWVPIDWSEVKNNSVTFRSVGRDIVYLPVCIENTGLTAIGHPFILSADGNINPIIASTSEVETLILTRKYPFFKRVDDFIKRMKGGIFQVANRSDFLDAVSIGTITEVPDPIFYAFRVNLQKQFRYVRYLSPKGGWGNIAELEVYDNKGAKLRGTVIGTSGSWEGTARTREKAFDSDILTFFDAPIADGAWVGLDLGKGMQLSKVQYMPRNDGNTIEKGDKYELVYWKDDWKRVEIQTATTDSLIFHRVPSNALYLLHDLTKGSEERIFTYYNSKQIWW
jgi:hypothetical protein